MNKVDSPKLFLVLLCFFLTVVYTYPLIFNLGSSFYGLPWDPLPGISYLWWLKFSYQHGLALDLQTYLAYPFGVDLAGNPFLYPFNLVGFVLTYLTDEVVAYNIIKLLSFPALALTTYLLLNYLTRDRVVSLFIGFACAFSPFNTINSMAHFHSLYWLPLVILFLLKFFDEGGGYKNGVLFGLFFGVTFVENTYYAYFVLLLFPVFLIFVLSRSREGREKLCNLKALKAALLSLLVIVLVVLPMLYPMLKVYFDPGLGAAEVHGLKKAFSDLFIFSAKPLDYLLPSKHNPFLGWLVPDLGMGSLKGHRYTTHTLYLGYTLLSLVGVALYFGVRRAGRLGANKRERQAVYLFFVVAIVAAILSAPPFIPLGEYQINFETREVFAEQKLYLPQYLLYKVFPMFRVYARLGAVVLLAVLVLAGFGLRELLAGAGTAKKRCLLLCLFSLLVTVEYAEFPPHRITEVREPEVYRWLAEDPEQFPIVEYPLGAGDDPYTTFQYKFYQRIHTKYLVNGAVAGTPADEFRKSIIDISKPDVIDKLAGIGVRYVLVHEDKYVNGNETVPMDWVTAPPREKLFPVEYNDGKVPNLKLVKDRLRLVKSFGGAKVYELVEGSR
jgi:hypothetical protein